MKFVAQVGDLVAALKSVRDRAKGNSAEILNHIRFDLAGSRLTVAGHDGGSSSEATIGVEGGGDGMCAVPTGAVVRLTSALSKEAHISFESDGYLVTIKSGRSRYKLPVLSAEGFPQPLKCDEAVTIEMSADDVVRLFDRARGALDPRDQRPFGQGLYLHSADGALCSSGISLFHFVRLGTAVQAPDLTGVIVPLSAVDEIGKLLRSGGKVLVSARTIAAEAGGRRYCSTLVEGQYPDYSRKLPSLLDSYIEIDRLEALAAVRRLTAVASMGSVVDLKFGEGEIVASISGVGDGVEVIHASGDIGGESVVSFTAQRLVEALEMPTGETLQLHATPGSLFMRILDPSDPTSIFVASGRIPQAMQVAA